MKINCEHWLETGQFFRGKCAIGMFKGRPTFGCCVDLCSFCKTPRPELDEYMKANATKVKAKPESKARPKPTLAEMEKHYLMAAEKCNKAGKEVVSKEEYLRRRNICIECSGGWKCPKCSCHLWALVALVKQKCEKWSK